MLRRKKLIAKKREERKQLLMKERLSLITPRRQAQPFRPLQLRTPSILVETDEMVAIKRLPSIITCNPPAELSINSTAVMLRESSRSEEEINEYLERERVASVEIERKKKMVAPICNKAGYSYIGDMPADQIKTLGRKV